MHLVLLFLWNAYLPSDFKILQLDIIISINLFFAFGTEFNLIIHIFHIIKWTGKAFDLN